MAPAAFARDVPAPPPPMPAPVTPGPRDAAPVVRIPAARRSAQRVPLLCPSPPGNERPRRTLSAVASEGGAGPEAVGELEAAAFAGRFVAEFLSWDEDDPARRAEVLRSMLRDPSGATLGWSGAGRQRVETVLPGRTLRTPDGGVIVEVTARVRTFRRTGPRPDVTPADSDAQPSGASCCPPDSSPGWLPAEATWTRVAPPVVRLPGGELRIDLALTARGLQR
ncbi:MAG: hypothetical protein J0I34_29925 [Pseudonocardia sp.]|uniref:hypothetical protein n=1 Tax=unclassified Pseudonocardia TaxID=2619320 RepID=UPI00086D271A|nr:MULTISPECIES: hypothetical protein [unclassified Pseudonocardia]MBN9112991.1 hypothetical protein [Pseudonocardia sp.]ODU25832.1 MAG: hypothetical protein ABS80_08885 [Pseudonocardia sp. SCN 72-51]